MSGLPSQEKAKAKAPKPKKPSKQKRKLDAALTKLALPTQASEDLAFLYRKTTVAQALAEALEEFGETQELPEHVVAETMEAFDKVRARGRGRWWWVVGGWRGGGVREGR